MESMMPSGRWREMCSTWAIIVYSTQHSAQVSGLGFHLPWRQTDKETDRCPGADRLEQKRRGGRKRAWSMMDGWGRVAGGGRLCGPRQGSVLAWERISQLGAYCVLCIVQSTVCTLGAMDWAHLSLL